MTVTGWLVSQLAGLVFSPAWQAFPAQPFPGRFRYNGKRRRQGSTCRRQSYCA